MPLSKGVSHFATSNAALCGLSITQTVTTRYSMTVTETAQPPVRVAPLSLLVAHITSAAPFGRALPPCTDGSAHHLADSRRTAS